jgi:2-oxoglutarate/2-oxoacid ferredoxin oxidoreductase subunit alpha
MIDPNVSVASSDSPEVTLKNLSIRLAGRAQDGIQSLGGFLARLAGRSDQEVMTFMTIPSTVAGGNSVFQVRMGAEGVLSVGDEVDVLVAFYQDSYEEHGPLLKEGGILLYDSDEVAPGAEQDRYKLVPVPFSKATEEALGGKGRGKNLFVLGLLARLFNLDESKLRGLMEERFGRKKTGVLEDALKAFETGLGYDTGSALGRVYRFAVRARQDASRPQVTMDGNQAMAFGLLAAGVRYGASYPITPATPIMEILRAELPKYGGIFLQTEDELAAICAAIGMSYGGHLACTTTSGPGMSLKLEALSFATMAEIPLLVVNVQRGGPSTGIPTQVEQSDLMQAIWGSHGDNPRPVLAARNVEDCFYIALEAAAIARTYSTPVVILTDQILATRVEGFEEPDLARLMIEPKIDLTPRPADFLPYDPAKLTAHAAPGTRMLSGKYPTVTGLEHDPEGKPNPGPANHMRMTAKRREKIRQVVKEFPNAGTEVFGDAQGDLLLVGWGSTYGPIREATRQLQEKGLAASHYHLRHIHPLPDGLAELFAGFKDIRVIEMNDYGLYGYGQLATHLRSVFANPKITSFCKTDGLTFRVREILQNMRPDLFA